MSGRNTLRAYDRVSFIGGHPLLGGDCFGFLEDY